MTSATPSIQSRPALLSRPAALLFFLAGRAADFAAAGGLCCSSGILFFLFPFLLFPLFGGSHLAGGDVVCACVGGVRLCGCSI
jgi:hypothetical protein